MAREEQQIVMKKQRPSTFVGGLLNALFSAFKFILWLLFMIITRLGLWIPILYVLFGAGLYLFADFNPFNLESAESILFLVGFGASVLCALIIAVRNVVVKPLKGVVEGYKNPFWKKSEAKGAKREGKSSAEPPRKETADYADVYEDERRPRAERPKIYRSELEPDSIVHEYGDRFEVFVKLADGREILDKIEYKRDL